MWTARVSRLSFRFLWLCLHQLNAKLILIKEFNNTHRKNCVLLSSAEEFIEIQAWLWLLKYWNSRHFCYMFYVHVVCFIMYLLYIYMYIIYFLVLLHISIFIIFWLFYILILNLRDNFFSIICAKCLNLKFLLIIRFFMGTY